MPFISLKTNLPLNRQEILDLKTLFGQAIEAVPGKTEQELLVVIEPETAMYLRGKEDPLALVNVSVFNNPKRLGYADLARLISLAVQKVLNIPVAHTYIEFHAITSWSVAGYYMEDNDDADS
ncbi:hypothetical protein DDV21_001745 [Streptococcus chenjunshii]|uniref:Macrophage migration inhibitory factor (MIF) n=1 Tax=Streptococcus chenjunshii TaxID=2173853 RepID=A0A372KJE8_9STRE|nr:phenylpyruvate tautomerase MIF-related protein [Streptococcus chenjunshii]AXQ77882.1 hypothetical protein DDV21_001745 [Streptococcus chenjunshii]RFU50208.1 hypothetical protein DDV22_09900 [Streptococcus chenjunshii]RFU52387.1 hypothetical protein DDV23_09995 [Streptococcus chenjunshii]